MSWSKDQRAWDALDLRASGVDKPAEHPARSVMARRWEERRAQADSRRSEPTSSIVLKRAVIEDATPTGLRDESHKIERAATQRIIEDAQDTQRRAAAYADPLASTPAPAPAPAPAPDLFHNTGRAMFVIALLSTSALLALLYFGGFLG